MLVEIDKDPPMKRNLEQDSGWGNTQSRKRSVAITVKKTIGAHQVDWIAWQFQGLSLSRDLVLHSGCRTLVLAGISVQMEDITATVTDKYLCPVKSQIILTPLVAYFFDPPLRD